MPQTRAYLRGLRRKYRLGEFARQSRRKGPTKRFARRVVKRLRRRRKSLSNRLRMRNINMPDIGRSDLYRSDNQRAYTASAPQSVPPRAYAAPGRDPARGP